MTMQPSQPVQRGVEIHVPLSKLKASPRNARRTPHAPTDIESLAASIAVKGLLQPPVVEPERSAEGGETGAYLVTIGEGRRQALRLLAKRKQISKTAPVRCLLDSDNDAFEISLDENVTRFAMHPADQFEAFRDLAETKGWSAEEIGARFGITAHTVRQRLRLGAVSPNLLRLYRDGELGLDQLMAFAVTDDHARQEQVYEQLSYNRSPSYIRRVLTEAEVPATDRRAVFIGPEAYEAAGGRIRRDLFAEDQGGWFEDVGLLEELVLSALRTEAERLRLAEGWRWAESLLDYPHDHGLRRLYPHSPAHDDATKARLKALADEYDGHIASLGEDAEAPPEIETRLGEIEAELAAAAAPVFDDEQRALAGLLVSLGRDGKVRVDRGFVRPQDEPPAPEAEAAEGADADREEGSGEAEVDGGPKPLPERLIADLAAHRTAALRDRLAEHPEAAFLALLHVLVQQTFGHGRGGSCLEITLTHTALEPYAEGIADTPAVEAIEARHAHWAARLPESRDAVWTALAQLSAEERLSLLAHCVSLSLNAVRTRSSAWGRWSDDDLADLVGLDMRRYWQATPQSYFGRLSKAQILAAVAEAHPEAVARLDGLKKDALVQAAADLLGAEGWLPPLLRPAAAPPA
ncbi:ParB/RepB/Spo0J family partition protein [Brevundimonas sp. 2R-24]|uniref:ParB/RepB/Spo0J family partition protein n=1 Tax=Peiella sedimenti TaxID=3061083 RepID=A0ABT8SQA9_9CAUL|nr:ParB/RepB/Spo0J family partition protein [Caulobacteraceae bacterium XZ-24]